MNEIHIQVISACLAFYKKIKNYIVIIFNKTYNHSTEQTALQVYKYLTLNLFPSVIL